MRIEASNPQEYIDQVPEERKAAFEKLRKTILENLPAGFEEEMSYGMIGFVVPKSIYPAGYHCKPNPSLPFVSIASQKNFIGFYHMGMYADNDLYDWFTKAYTAQSKYKIDMGKSCLRLKRMDDIPYELIGELMQKMTPQQWIDVYEAAFKK